MGKVEPLCPKAIDNRQKALRRQKLKWYCPPCRKQCRDENGFKCHCSSDGHMRLLGLFGESLAAGVERNSTLFESAFLEHLRMSHCGSRVSANAVYNDYIGDPHHLHMKATKWATLTEFVTYLGKEGICKVDDTPKGWIITYQGQRADALLQSNLQEKRHRGDLAYEERHERALLQQISAAMHTMPSPLLPPTPSPATATTTTTPTSKISFSLHLPPKHPPSTADKLPLFAFESAASSIATAPVLDAIWISPGLVIKVTALNCHYKKKGVVQKVLHDKRSTVAVVETLDTGDVFHALQSDLQTVIPQLGALVRIVRGQYCGSTAQLLSIETASFSAAVRLEAGSVLPSVDFEDICRQQHGWHAAVAEQYRYSLQV